MSEEAQMMEMAALPRLGHGMPDAHAGKLSNTSRGQANAHRRAGHSYSNLDQG